ncbi:response regulator [Phenylobacterium conjunctum]|uniref:Response regulator n=1 Tax=Phenylobacterium conjunctum TaxID=1298959 RepID=A0ABW3T560_9CAUL
MPEPDYGRLSILVVDDSRDMREIIGAVLTGVGVTKLHFAADGASGLASVAAYDFDIVFVDQEMPGYRGLDVIRAIRGRRDGKQFLPIIMLTGHSDLRHLVEARDAGVTEFLCKPVTARAIVERLLTVIHRPRPFIRCATYFGPDRRRGDRCAFDGPERRATKADAIAPPRVGRPRSGAGARGRLGGNGGHLGAERRPPIKA